MTPKKKQGKLKKKNYSLGQGRKPNLNYGGDVPPGGGGGGPDRLPSFDENGNPIGAPISQGELGYTPIRGTDARAGNLTPGQIASFSTGAQFQSKGGNKKWERLQKQWRAGDPKDRRRITQMMMQQTNYDDGRPDTGEVATWLKRQMMPAEQQDQQRIRNLTQTLGSRMADPYSGYNLAGEQWAPRGQAHVNELGGLLQDYGDYRFNWGSGDNTRGGWGGNENRAGINQYLGVGAPKDIWSQLFPGGYGGTESNPNPPPPRGNPTPAPVGVGGPDGLPSFNPDGSPVGGGGVRSTPPRYYMPQASGAAPTPEPRFTGVGSTGLGGERWRQGGSQTQPRYGGRVRRRRPMTSYGGPTL